MKARVVLIIGFMLVLLVSGCRRHGDDEAAQAAALLRTDKVFSDTSVKDGFAAAFSRYALTDVTLLPQGTAAVIGKPQATRFLADIPADTRISWTPQAAEISADLGYTWGIYTSAGTTAGGQATVAYGKYLSVWKRQDGDWKLALMMINQSPGPAG